MKRKRNDEKVDQVVPKLRAEVMLGPQVADEMDPEFGAAKQYYTPEVLLSSFVGDVLSMERVEVPVESGYEGSIEAIYIQIEEAHINKYVIRGNEAIEVYYVKLNEEDDPMIDMQPYQTQEEDAPAFKQMILPHRHLDGLWESLVLPRGTKDSLYSMATSSKIFAASKLDFSLVAYNRIILFYGPPGTGKTTLSKALAHKLSITQGAKENILLEINAHSLFSKWFSESGKLVMKLFQTIREMAMSEGVQLYLLIDEVESLTAARSSASSGNEPSDAIRVVNAVLTQLDQMQRYENVLIMCTSNITTAIDNAFLDRADMKIYLGPPDKAARYEIMRGMLQELCRGGLLDHHLAFPWYGGGVELEGLQLDVSPILRKLAEESEGMSGRGLRKLAFLTHAHGRFGEKKAEIEAFLEAMGEVIQQSKQMKAC